MRKIILASIILIALVIIIGVSILRPLHALGEKNIDIGDKCTQNIDCKLPLEYAVRSICPFESLCIENACKVVCINPHKTQEDDLKQSPQCAKNSDCDCSSFYAANDIIGCSCIAGLCTAIVAQ